MDKCLPISGGSALGTGLFSTVVPYLLAFIKSSRVDVDVGGMWYVSSIGRPYISTHNFIGTRDIKFESIPVIYIWRENDLDWHE